MRGVKTHLTVIFIFTISNQYLILPLFTHIELYTASNT